MFVVVQSKLTLFTFLFYFKDAAKMPAVPCKGCPLEASYEVAAQNEQP